ncbi:MAG: DNA cytosine methyltransferase [Rubrivivax sp.]|nr:DNA cytosine methyltransferase [Rubrivivax sp.]
MTARQFILPLAHELIVDLFAGGGGASTGIEQALGRHVDIAVNHDPEAVSLHQANHPQTRHYVSDVFEVDPLAVCGDQPVGLLWASPDCKHFSKAKGGKPVSKKIRGLAWVVVKWAKLVRPRIICLENVEEFQTWGPLLEDGMPCPQRKGLTFRRWVAQLRNLGYAVEWRELRACDYGAPTIRKRLFLVARCDGAPIVWPQPTHAKDPAKGSRLKPWRTAAECIDWSLPCPSIFERERPLAEATLRRIAHGVKRYVLEAARPFIVPVTHQGDNRVHSADEPLRTVTSAKRGELALAVPTLVQTGYGERAGQAPRVPGLDKPLGTAVDGQKHALVAAFLAKHYGGVVGSALPEPIGTVTSIDHHALVASNLVKLRGTSNSASSAEPVATISAGGQHHAEVRAFLVRYFGTDQDPRIEDPLATITTKHRDAVVTVQVGGEPYVITDLGMRMLQPRELYRAQGFPENYVIDRGADGRVLTKAAQVRMCGNSVVPALAAALVRANYVEADLAERIAA